MKYFKQVTLFVNILCAAEGGKFIRAHSAAQGGAAVA